MTNDHGMNRYSLRFADHATEAAFVQSQKDRLAANFFHCMLAAAVIGASASVNVRVWEHISPHKHVFENSIAREVHTFISYVLLAVLACLITVMVCFRMPFLIHRVPPPALEVLCVVLLCLGMTVVVSVQPHYLVRLWGRDPASVLPIVHSDSTFLLTLDTCITASHLILPIRWDRLVPVQIHAVLSYVLPAVLLGAPESERTGLTQSIVCLLCLVVLAGFGKRAMERHERLMFLNLILEKSLRCNSEFQLSQVGRGTGRDPTAGQVPGSSTESCTDSAPSTTDSALAFIGSITDSALSQDELLWKIFVIGEKEQWLVRFTDITLRPDLILGEGSFGVVISGSYEGTPVAIKLAKERCREGFDHLRALCNELGILRRLRHPNIVFLYGACFDAPDAGLCLILEKVEGVTLRDSILRPKGVHLEELGLKDRLQILVDISCALRYLHNRAPRIIHGDLKDTNIFVKRVFTSRAVHAKLLDFGLSRFRTRHAKPLGGTLEYMPPETVRHRGLEPRVSADVYSFGRLVFFVVTGSSPANGIRRDLLLKLLKQGRAPRLQWPSNRWASTYEDLVEQCCTIDFEARPTIAHVHKDLQTRLEKEEDQGSLSDMCGGQAMQSLSQQRGAFSMHAFRKHWDLLHWGYQHFAETRKEPTSLLPPASQTEGTDPVIQDTAGLGLQRGLASVPEHDVVNTGQPSSTQRSSPPTPPDGRTVLPNLAPTKESTLQTMALDVLLHANLEIGTQACCPFHGGARRLRDVYVSFEARGCINRLYEDVVGQCGECSALLLEPDLSTSGVPLVCRHCGEPVDPETTGLIRL